MARIEHVALWVRDLEATCAFYAKFFGAVPGMLYENRGKGFASRFVTFESGARLEIMTTTVLDPVAAAPNRAGRRRSLPTTGRYRR